MEDGPKTLACSFHVHFILILPQPVLNVNERFMEENRIFSLLPFDYSI